MEFEFLLGYGSINMNHYWINTMQSNITPSSYSPTCELFRLALIYPNTKYKVTFYFCSMLSTLTFSGLLLNNNKSSGYSAFSDDQITETTIMLLFSGIAQVAISAISYELRKDHILYTLLGAISCYVAVPLLFGLFTINQDHHQRYQWQAPLALGQAYGLSAIMSPKINDIIKIFTHHCREQNHYDGLLPN